MRTGTTSSGRQVLLNTTTKVEGGYTGYVLNGRGVAVQVFIPTE